MLNETSNKAAILLTSPENFKSWERAFKIKVRAQSIANVIIDGNKPVEIPDKTTRPIIPTPPTHNVYPPAAGTQSSVTPRAMANSFLDEQCQAYQERVKEWEIDMKIWQATSLEPWERNQKEKKMRYKEQQENFQKVVKWMEDTISVCIKLTCLILKQGPETLGNQII